MKQPTSEEPLNVLPWRSTSRRETGLLEHHCEHGVGHPVEGSADWMALSSGAPRGDNPFMVHGCDGCCGSTEWQLASLRQSVTIANEIILEHKRLIETIREIYEGDVDEEA